MAVGFAGHGSSAFHVGIYAGRRMSPHCRCGRARGGNMRKIPIFGHRSTAPRRACADAPRHGKPVRLSGESVGPPGAYGARAHFLTIMDKSDHSEFKYLVANESDHRMGPYRHVGGLSAGGPRRGLSVSDSSARLLFRRCFRARARRVPVDLCRRRRGDAPHGKRQLPADGRYRCS